MPRNTSIFCIGTFYNSVVHVIKEIREWLTELTQKTNNIYDLILAVFVNNKVHIEGPISVGW
jgi:phage-related protein